MFEDAKRFVNKHFTFDLCYAIFSTQIHWSEASIRKILFETIRATFDIRNLKTLNNIINVHFAARNPSKHLIFWSAKKKVVGEIFHQNRFFFGVFSKQYVYPLKAKFLIIRLTIKWQYYVSSKSGESTLYWINSVIIISMRLFLEQWTFSLPKHLRFKNTFQ